jgi:hypothetical protein
LMIHITFENAEGVALTNGIDTFHFSSDWVLVHLSEFRRK